MYNNFPSIIITGLRIFAHLLEISRYNAYNVGKYIKHQKHLKNENNFYSFFNKIK